LPYISASEAPEITPPDDNTDFAKSKASVRVSRRASVEVGALSTGSGGDSTVGALSTGSGMDAAEAETSWSAASGAPVKSRRRRTDSKANASAIGGHTPTATGSHSHPAGSVPEPGRRAAAMFAPTEAHNPRIREIIVIPGIPLPC